MMSDHEKEEANVQNVEGKLRIAFMYNIFRVELNNIKVSRNSPYESVKLSILIQIGASNQNRVLT